jgi:magnesium-transporting ATPase (P-type)
MDIESTRAQYPIATFEVEGTVNEVQIPFSSEIKFNLLVRDMMKSNKNPNSPAENMMVILKGAPERVLNRCNKILI